jgi:serine/threonine-protein kinase RsbW
MAEIPNVCLHLPNRPENVLVVRQALIGLAHSLALDGIETNDLNTAVSEACNNVVMHAYGSEEGPLEVDVFTRTDAIEVVVRDRGIGLPARDQDEDGEEKANEDEDEGGHAGIGIPVITALSRRVQFADVAGGGTEVRMEFAAPAGVQLEPIDGDSSQFEPTTVTRAQLSHPPGTVELRLASTALARAVLPRVLCALAARAHFTTDRIADVQLLADALAANAVDSISATHLDIAVTVAAPRNLDLRIGPLRSGRAESLVSAAAESMAPVIERLADTRHVARTDSAETLELRLLDRR